VFVWLRGARHFEKRNLLMLAFAITATLLCGAWTLLGPGRLFGTGNALPLVIGEALAGLATSAFFVLPYSMLADVADEDEALTGSRREGLFVGVFRSGQLLGAAVSVLGIGFLVDWFAGLVPGQAQQSVETAERLGFLASVLPAVLLVPAALLLVRYPLSRARVIAIQRELGRDSGVAQTRASIAVHAG